MSTICSSFIHRGGSVCTVTGPRQYSADLPQGRLEVLCILTFTISNDKEGDKARRLLVHTLSVEIKANVCKYEKDCSTESSNNSFGRKEVPVKSPAAVSLDIVPVDEVLESSEPPLKKNKLSTSAVEDVIMGEELSDVYINLAQNLVFFVFLNVRQRFKYLGICRRYC